MYFSEAVFFDPSVTARIPLEGPAPLSDDISTSDPALASLSVRAAFFAALGLATDFLTGCFVVAFASLFFALNQNPGESAQPRSQRY